MSQCLAASLLNLSALKAETVLESCLAREADSGLDKERGESELDWLQSSDIVVEL